MATDSRHTVKQTAERLGVSASLVYQWCQEKRLAHVRLGKAGRRGKILIEETDVEAFVAAARVEAGEAASSPVMRHITRR